MKRLLLPLLAALAFIAISEPPSATGRPGPMDGEIYHDDHHRDRRGETSKPLPEDRWCYAKPEIKCAMGLCVKKCKRKTGDGRNCGHYLGRIECTG